VNVVGQVSFSAFQNRFELTIDKTAARYLKVVTRPLAAGVTVDPRFSDVFVTELQAYLILPAQQVRGTTSTTIHVASGSFRQLLLANPNLAYDFSGVLTTGTGGSSYTVQNGLSLERSFARTFALLARVTRQDTGQFISGQPSIHRGLLQYSASVTGRPLPTLSESLTYSGQYTETARGTAKLNSVTFVNRAQLYRGLDALTSLGYNYNYLDTGAMSYGPTVIATLSVVPNRIVTLAGSYYLASTHQTGGGLPDSDTEDERVDGTIAISPFPALYLSGTVTRIIKGFRPTTLASLTGSFSPFPDGNFLLRSSYSESIDTSLGVKSGVGTVGARWNFTQGAYLDLGYSFVDGSSNAGSNSSRVLAATLVLQL